MTIEIEMAHLGDEATREQTEWAAQWLNDHGFDVRVVDATSDHSVGEIPDVYWDAAVAYAVSMCDKETNARLNAYVRENNPEWRDIEWREYRSNGKGAYWYIDAGEYNPYYNNIIEGETGELMYLNREDAIDQWGEDVEWLREYGWDEDEEAALSLNNGNTYYGGAALDAELDRWEEPEAEALNAIEHIEASGRFSEPGTPSEACYDAISSECGAWETNRETLHAILHRLWEGGVNEYALP